MSETLMNPPGLQLVYLAPADIQIARVDRQCIIYACEGLQRCGVGVELVALRIRIRPEEVKAENPMDLYRVKEPPPLRQVPTLLHQDSGSPWISANRLAAHLWVALGYRGRDPGRRLCFYTKNYSTAILLLWLRRVRGAAWKIVFEAHTLPRGPHQRYVLRNVDGIVANSYTLEADLRPHLGRVPMIGLHQGVDLEHYNSLRSSREDARRKLGLPADRRIVVYTGKVYWGYREVELLLQAAERMADVADFLIVGGRGDHAARYQDLVKERGYRNVSFTGFVVPKLVQDYQLAADALVCYYPSGMELNRYRSPGKLFEYMAAGRAIVAADYVSIREVVDETCAVIVPPDNVIVLADTLRALLKDRVRMEVLGEAAVRRVSEFTWLKRSGLLKQFLLDLVP